MPTPHAIFQVGPQALPEFRHSPQSTGEQGGGGQPLLADGPFVHAGWSIGRHRRREVECMRDVQGNRNEDPPSSPRCCGGAPPQFFHLSYSPALGLDLSGLYMKIEFLAESDDHFLRSWKHGCGCQDPTFEHRKLTGLDLLWEQEMNFALPNSHAITANPENSQPKPRKLRIKYGNKTWTMHHIKLNSQPSSAGKGAVDSKLTAADDSPNILRCRGSDKFKASFQSMHSS